jgi:hypothetical protein
MIARAHTRGKGLVPAITGRALGMLMLGATFWHMPAVNETENCIDDTQCASQLDALLLEEEAQEAQPLAADPQATASVPTIRVDGEVLG